MSQTGNAGPAPGTTPGELLLDVQGIGKSYPGVRALHEVSFGVRRGSIHALLGENGAGKSTLMNVLFGFAQADSGQLLLHGRRLDVRGPRDAIEQGIGMVHQHFMLVSDLTVAENTALQSARLGRLGMRLPELRARIRELATAYGLAVDPDARIDRLSVGEQQRVELMKVLVADSEVIVLDEPTAVLTGVEWAELRQVLRRLADDGRTIIFITHKLDEVIGLADRATVLRLGEVVGTVERDRFDRNELARMMVGRAIDLSNTPHSVQPGDVRLECRSLTLVHPDGRRGITDVTLRVRSGEIVAIAGVDGNGQTELVDAIVGLEPPTEGEVVLDGTTTTGAHSGRFRELGGAYVPGDRARRGMAGDLSVLDNALLNQGLRRAHLRHGLLDVRGARRHVRRLADQYDVRMSGLDTRMSLLSGGNQQKIVLARELHDGPRLLIASQPTRGLDVGACEFVYRQLRDYRDAGGAVLLVSTELEEILNISDRTHVMVDGTLSPSMDTRDLTVDRLGLLLGGARFEAES
jgi:simple sugar transport system ATP-binding protein